MNVQDARFCSLSISYTKVHMKISSLIAGNTTVKTYNVVYNIIFSVALRSFVKSHRITSVLSWLGLRDANFFNTTRLL